MTKLTYKTGTDDNKSGQTQKTPGAGLDKERDKTMQTPKQGDIGGQKKPDNKGGTDRKF